ncbi:DUF2524 family protein [Bacillus sp. CECT 9360]|uniref:DUF2524 family protein n=1 Tax=Bacillus sp. CECT 9360 TaxID=2845821 RepID=UPI001E54D099|nr:DUF2524 family protein [Bacillus sp. CECT 9360]CAH0346805.1 hypothetical protein BCI9360_03166 [Bacillus sp. CECT 9360]
MATRQSVENCIQQCEDALRSATDQYREASTQEHDNDLDFIQSQQELQSALNNVETLANSSNTQQREQLLRMKLQLDQMRHNMTVLDHDR